MLISFQIIPVIDIQGWLEMLRCMRKKETVSELGIEFGNKILAHHGGMKWHLTYF